MSSRRVDDFIRRLDKHANKPSVCAAVDQFWNRVQEAEAGLGHEVTTRQWLDKRWMEQHCLSDALDRPFLAVYEAEADAASRQGGTL